VALVGNVAGEVTLPEAEYSALLRREVRVVGSWNSVPWGLAHNDWSAVLELMAAGRLPAGKLVSHRFPLARVGEALAVMRSEEFHHRVLLEM
jgi:threonine dehydrogenase-like Zn-dependent dehydrogenase